MKKKSFPHGSAHQLELAVDGTDSVEEQRYVLH
jgi:ribose 5-phosphate isomerase